MDILSKVLGIPELGPENSTAYTLPCGCLVRIGCGICRITNPDGHEHPDPPTNKEDKMKRVYKITGFSEDIARHSLESLGLSEKSVDAMMNIWPRNPDGSYKPLVGTEAEQFYDSAATLILTDSASEH